jgi:F0F1-type ATP synthase membrane subunit a
LVFGYLSIVLFLSLSCLSATYIVNILSTVLTSILLLRFIELIQISFFIALINYQLCMEVTSLLLLFPSILLESISIGFRSLSLGFRIFANIAAGHVLSDIILVIRYLFLNNIFYVLMQIIFSYIIIIYELCVAIIQLGVFLSLISVYIE